MKPRVMYSRRIFLFIVILALASQACAISLAEWPIPNFPGAPSTPPPTGPTPTPLPRAEVTFTVQLPEPLPANEALAVSVVDEVTGLQLNAIDYQMTAVDNITYTTTLAIPDQAVIKYRYIRRGPSSIVEDTNLDSSIRYRMVFINGPTRIMETVSSWADKSVVGLASKAKDPKSLALLAAALSFEPYAIALPRGDWEMRLAVNWALAQIYRTGAIVEIFGRWFGAMGRPSALMETMFLLGAVPE